MSLRLQNKSISCRGDEIFRYSGMDSTELQPNGHFKLNLSGITIVYQILHF